MRSRGTSALALGVQGVGCALPALGGALVAWAPSEVHSKLGPGPESREGPPTSLGEGSTSCKLSLN